MFPGCNTTKKEKKEKKESKETTWHYEVNSFLNNKQ